MKVDYVKYLKCPVSSSQLKLVVFEQIGDRIKFGELISECGQYRYSILNFIPRFVELNNYSNSFGWQWNKFAKTQLDSQSGHGITHNRFWKATGWQGKIDSSDWILDAGCGSGRFAEVSSKSGAMIVAIDYSNAVEACYDNLGEHENIFIIQCDIYKLPFENNFFDKVYSLGVLQHTPNVEEAVASLSKKVKKEGLICFDFYEKTILTPFHPKYLLRPFTKRIDKERLFSFLQKNIVWLLSISNFFRKIPLIGNFLSRFVPVANYTGILPLSKSQLKEWALLDTFDWLTPEFDNPQTRTTINNWLEDFGFYEIEVLKEGHIVGRGKKI